MASVKQNTTIPVREEVIKKSEIKKIKLKKTKYVRI